MEDSYTVHRRRKAAARKREKTPEPPRRRQEDVTETDEEEDARARIERMVRETEMLEELDDKKRAENDKSGEKSMMVLEEKAQRAMKRAMSPEVRRRDEENRDSGEKLDEKSKIEVSKSEKSEKSEKTGRQDVEPKKTSDLDASPEVENATKLRVEETPKKVKNNDASILKNRRDPPRDLSPEIVDNSGTNSTPKKMADVEKPDNIRSDETNRDETRSRNFGNSRKTSSRALDEVERETETKILDENRREPVPRENYADSEVSGRSGKSLKYERQETSGVTRAREVEEKLIKHGEEEKVRREMTSPSKGRSSEARNTSKVSSKRSSKDRLEKTGYTTDSSETEETSKRLLRRKKSPEGAKSRSSSGKKIASRSRPTTDTEGDEQQQEGRKRIDKKVSSRRRRSSETEDEDLNLRDRPRSPSTRDKKELIPRAPPRQVEKGKSDRKSARYFSDLSDDYTKTMSKSETFPSDKTAREKSPSRTKSSQEIKKQIIPLSDDSLIEDFERAQLDYFRKERSIFDPDPLDDYVDPRMEAALRQRKFSIIQSKEEAQLVAEKAQLGEKKSWFSWIPFFGKRAKKEKVDDENETRESSDKPEKIRSRDATMKTASLLKQSEELGDTKICEKDKIVPKKVSFLEFFRTLTDFVSEFRAFIEQNPRETQIIRVLRNRCFVELLFAIIYCGLGAFVFRFTEGAFETFYKCGVKRVKRDFLDTLWNFSHNMREEDWKSMARRKLMEFEEQLHTAHEAGVHSYSGQKSWSFLNAVLYCLTVITTIGYGHIAPSTTTGRAITIVYAIFGIPMFLIILADFGKLFTRGIKFLWAFVRRVYYTGSCRRVRRTVPVQEVMKGVQLVYDLATFRRPSQMNPEEIEEMEKQQNQTQTVLNLDGNAPPSAQPHTPGTPGTPALSTFAIDDEFNLPISVAIIILLVYIFVGATVYTFWEQWAFFESFYFVFISMSTIGFGDFVPRHPIYMMLSIVYLVFGLALTSMCINVVQVMLSESFRQASQKIGATIGFEVTEEDGSVHPGVPPPVEVADVHETIKESESEEQVAPKAKQEDLEL